MSDEANDRAITQLLKQAIASLELAVELMGEAKAKEQKKPPLLLTKIAKQKLVELQRAEREAQRHE